MNYKAFTSPPAKVTRTRKSELELAVANYVNFEDWETLIERIIDDEPNLEAICEILLEMGALSDEIYESVSHAIFYSTDVRTSWISDNCRNLFQAAVPSPIQSDSYYLRLCLDETADVVFHEEDFPDIFQAIIARITSHGEYQFHALASCVLEQVVSWCHNQNIRELKFAAKQLIIYCLHLGLSNDKFDADLASHLSELVIETVPTLEDLDDLVSTFPHDERIAFIQEIEPHITSDH